MVSHALRPDVGAVGAKLYYANDTVQHGGVILGIGSVAGHSHRNSPRQSPGYFNRLNLTHNLSCVTGACLAIRRKICDEVGGFNEQDLAVSYNDVDFCIRIRQAVTCPSNFGPTIKATQRVYALVRQVGPILFDGTLRHRLDSLAAGSSGA